LGLACAYGIHLFQASQVQNVFSPYRSIESVRAIQEYRRPPYSFIATPTTIEFGEIENYKRYHADWEVLNSGASPLELEIVSATCDVAFDGQPMPANASIPERTSARLEMSWVVESSDPEFRHVLQLRTNDGVESRRNLEFVVHGTVNPAIDIVPPVLDFGTVGEGQAQELATELLCYRTKTFEIQEIAFSDESLRAGLEVNLHPIDDLSKFSGERTPASALSVTVKVMGDKLEKKSYDEWLVLQSNLPESEPLRIGLRVNVK
jgi:hypothetical protein